MSDEEHVGGDTTTHRRKRDESQDAADGGSQHEATQESEFERPKKRGKVTDDTRDDEFYSNRTTVVVRGLPKTMDARVLGDFMGSTGSLKGVRISTAGEKHNEPRGFAYVSYFDGRDAEAAVMKLNRSHLSGHEISVEFVRCFRCGREGHFTRDCNYVSTPVNRRKTTGLSSLSSGGSSLQLLQSQTQHSQPDPPTLLDLSTTSHEAAAASQLFQSDSQVLQSVPSSIKIESQSSIVAGGDASQQLNRTISEIDAEQISHPLMDPITDAEMLEAVVGIDQHSQHDIESLFDAKHDPDHQSQPADSQQSVQIIEHLTKRQLRVGLEVLQELQSLLLENENDHDAIKHQILDLTNKFYTLVPHKFLPNQRPTLLNDLEIVEAKIHKIEDMMQIY